MSQYVSTLSDYKLNYLRDFEDRNKHLSIEPERLYNAVQKSLSALREPITKLEFISYFNGSHWMEVNLPNEHEINNENKSPSLHTTKISPPTEEDVKLGTSPKETHNQVSNSNKTQEFTNEESALVAGYEKFVAQRYREAAKEFKKCIDAGYEKALCLEFMGRIELATLNYTKAKSYFDKAIALNPYNCQTYSLRGMTKEAQGDLEGYIRDLEKAKQVYALDHPQAKEHSEEMDRLSKQESGRTFIETCDSIIMAQSTLITAYASIEKTDRQLKELGINDDEFEVLNTFFDDNYENKGEQLSNVYIAYKGAHKNNFVSWSTFKAYFSKFYIEQELKQFKEIIVDDYIEEKGNDIDVVKSEEIEKSDTDSRTGYQKFKDRFPYFITGLIVWNFYFFIGVDYHPERFILNMGNFILFTYAAPSFISLVIGKLLYMDFPAKLYKTLVIVMITLIGLLCFSEAQYYQERLQSKERYKTFQAQEAK